MTEPALAHDEPTTMVAGQVPPADRHPAAVYLASLAPGSRRTMRQALEVIAGLLSGRRADAESLAWPALRYQHTQAIRAQLAERYRPATANKMLAALRGVLREAWRLGYVNAEEYHRAADLQAVRGSTLPRGRALTTGELRTLFAAVAEDSRPATRARDAALLAVLYGAGVRRAEAVGLDVADYDPETGALTIRHGKGRRERMMYATNGAREALAAWLTVRGADVGPLFTPVDKSGRIVPRRLTPESVFDRLEHLACRAGVARFSPHDCRRSFISDLLDNGADLAVVQAMAGHANPATTARYDRRGEHAKRRAAGLLCVPYIAP
ncbi:MAG: integrase [Deltaproteobacteria bacterium]|nr:MAG: integrase [Deltaproteobacteria bacterium]